MSHFKKHRESVTAVALVLAAFSTSCTAWHTVALEPGRFTAETSPEQARLTFGDGTQTTASHPVLAGDSLVWAGRGGVTPRDSARSAVLTSTIQRTEVHRVDAARTIILLAVLGGVVLGARAALIAYSNAVSN